MHMARKDTVKKSSTNVQHLNWKNPYQVKRKDKIVKEVKAKDSDSPPKKQVETAQNHSGADLMLVMNNFREGIRGISGSIQQFEKTMESLTQLYQTIDHLGGIKKLNQFLSPVNSVRGVTRGTNEAGNVFNHLKTFVGMLEKVDFNQINQFLGSPTIQGMVNDEQKE